MAKIWFTSDTHFSHKLMSKLRFFESIDAMNNHIIEVWNRLIDPKDTVYFLGDFCFEEHITFDILDALNGNIHLISGNHDVKFLRQLQNKKCSKIKSINQILDIKIDGIKIALCHYRMAVWNCSHYNTWHLYGHNHHTDLNNVGKSMNVGMDLHNLEPISWEYVKTEMEKRPDNFNLVEKYK